VRDLELGRLMRLLRRRRGWRQEDCARRAGVHRSTWSALEVGHLDGMTLGTLRRCAAVLEVRLHTVPRWRGTDLARLLDDDHAALQAAWADRLCRWGWQVRVEVSFNHYGDRGRVDLLAWHPAGRILVVGEIKSELADAQGLLGPLDIKVRLGPRLAAAAGWATPAIVVPLLVIRDGSTVRSRLARLAPLFASFVHRGRVAAGCLRHPERLAGGLLILSDLRTAGQGRVMRVGGQRVRLRRRSASVDGGRPGGGRALDPHSASVGGVLAVGRSPRSTEPGIAREPRLLQHGSHTGGGDQRSRPEEPEPHG
jgi:transcriptional regulator with XRE-family HTH domain